MKVTLLFLLIHCAVINGHETVKTTSYVSQISYQQQDDNEVSSEELTTQTGDASAAQYYTVSPNFVKLINEIKESDNDVDISVQDLPDGTFKVTLTIGGQSKVYDKVEANIFQLFVTLVQNPNLLIQTVGQEGSNVKIEVVEEPPASNVIQIKPELLKILKSVVTGGAQFKDEIVNGKYTFIITDSTGEHKFENIPEDVGEQFIFLARDPNLEYKVLSQSDNEATLSISDKTEDKPEKFTVTQSFLDLITKARKSPDTQVQIKPSTDGNYILILNGKEYRNIQTNLLFLLHTLIQEPSLQYKVIPAAGGKLTVVLPPRQPQSNVIEINDQSQINVGLKGRITGKHGSREHGSREHVSREHGGKKHGSCRHWIVRHSRHAKRRRVLRKHHHHCYRRNYHHGSHHGSHHGYHHGYHHGSHHGSYHGSHHGYHHGHHHG